MHVEEKGKDQTGHFGVHPGQETEKTEGKLLLLGIHTYFSIMRSVLLVDLTPLKCRDRSRRRSRSRERSRERRRGRRSKSRSRSRDRERPRSRRASSRDRERGRDERRRSDAGSSPDKQNSDRKDSILENLIVTITDETYPCARLSGLSKDTSFREVIQVPCICSYMLFQGFFET